MNLLQRGHQPIRTAARQIGLGDASGGDSQTTGSDSPCTRHIPLGVPDDQDLISRNPGSERLLRASMGDGSNDVPILVVVAESPKREFLPQAMGPQLQFGSQTNVSREEPDQRRRGEGTTGLQEGSDPGTGLPRMDIQLLREQEKIRLQEPLPIFRAHVEPMELEVLPDQRGVRSSVKVQVVGPSRNPKDQFRGAGKRLDPGTASADQGPIDIEQNHVHGQERQTAPSGLTPQRWPAA